jgi:tetratricopeptide (TPR) repeat protein
MKKSARLAIVILAGSSLLLGAQSSAQTMQQTPPSLKPQGVAPLTLENAPPPVNAEEDAAIKTFRDAPLSDVAAKNKLGEEFLAKYPQSRYRSEIYSWLVKAYLATDQVDKLEAAADKEIALNPNDAQTMAIVGYALPRKMNSATPDPEKRLDKAEECSKKALELLPTLPKPDALSEQDFLKAKDQTSALAYSGLGLVAIRRQKYGEAIPNFEQAVKLDPVPDPVNYYLLGLANEKTSHFEDAVAAYTKCSAIPGGLQTTCKSSADEAKKLSATQLQVPK